MPSRLLRAASRLAPFALLLAGVVMSAFLYAAAAAPGGAGIGVDYEAYHAAAARLLNSGSPYADWQLAGAYDTHTAFAYLYPPPFAVAVLPLQPLGAHLATWVWMGGQAMAIGASAWIVARPGQRIGALAAAIAFLPAVEAVRMANVSGFIALGTALVLVGTPRARAAAATAIGLLKTAPLALVVVAAVRHPRHTFVGAAPILLLSVLLTLPLAGAWLEYPLALANFAGGETAVNNTFAPAGFIAFRFPQLAGLESAIRLASLGLAIGAGLLAVAAARRRGGWLLAVAIGEIAVLLAPPVLWYHYLVAVLPLGIMAWTRANRRIKLVLAAAYATNSSLLFMDVSVGFAGMLIGLMAIALALRPRLDVAPARPATTAPSAD